MRYNFIIIVTMMDGNKHETKRDFVARELPVAREKMKNEIMKIGRNGYYTFEDGDLNPTYFPPTAILSVQSIDLN